MQQYLQLLSPTSSHPLAWVIVSLYLHLAATELAKRPYRLPHGYNPVHTSGALRIRALGGVESIVCRSSRGGNYKVSASREGYGIWQWGIGQINRRLVRGPCPHELLYFHYRQTRQETGS